jgi:Flp pilus assembly protein TadG
MYLPYYSRNKSTISKCVYNAPVYRANTPRNQRGIVMPLAAIGLLSLLGFAALAIDVGYLFVVRNELQNAADAAALAGAGRLVPYNSGAPDWDAAETGATDAFSQNKATNASLEDGQVQTGYCNITGNPKGLHPSSAGTDDLPGVMVTINKENGSNGGL